MVTIGKLVGVADEIGKAADLAKAVHDLATDPEKNRGEVSRKTRELADLLEDARGAGGSRTAFTAAWRPLVGWICGAALGYQLIGRDILITLLLNLVDNPVMPPPIDTMEMIAVLGSLLGIGGLRTIEKVKGVAK